LTRIANNTICIWYDREAEEAARFYAPAVSRQRGDGRVPLADGQSWQQGGRRARVVRTVCGIPCIGLNGGPLFPHTQAFSFQIATDTQEETDRYWNAIAKPCGGREEANPAGPRTDGALTGRSPRAP
jgi:predicted 3-demethylubiquinone-9 3-methyltransferase (glyoxalase superfamily)